MREEISGRIGVVERKTKETDIKVEVKLDESGEIRADTGIGFFDHMLTALAFRAHMSLIAECKGDLNVDGHHTVEDVGIALGAALSKALGSKRGINRYGSAALPMDESLANCSLDISGRAYTVFNAEFPKEYYCGDFEVQLAEEFFRAVSSNAGITLHINLAYGRNVHHMLEAIFKSVGAALGEAVKITGTEIQSTKGVL